MAILAFLAAMAMAESPSFPDPIAPVAAGKSQCYSPDIERKTCASLTTYSIDDSGALQATTAVLLSTNPPITMTSVSPVSIEDGRLCRQMRAADLDAATFTVDGAAPDATRAVQLHDTTARVFAPILDQVVCLSFVADGSGFVAHTSMGGLPRPGLDQRVLWISPADGWKVAP